MPQGTSASVAEKSPCWSYGLLSCLTLGMLAKLFMALALPSDYNLERVIINKCFSEVRVPPSQKPKSVALHKHSPNRGGGGWWGGRAGRQQRGWGSAAPQLSSSAGGLTAGEKRLGGLAYLACHRKVERRVWVCGRGDEGAGGGLSVHAPRRTRTHEAAG